MTRSPGGATGDGATRGKPKSTAVAGPANSTSSRALEPAAAPAGAGWRSRVVPVVLVLGSIIGLVASGYLSITRLNGGLPVCGPVQGCDTVALSPYSEILGVPVAYLGFGYSLVLFGLIAAWLRAADRRLLYAAYALGMLGIVFVAYLTYLELFVIHAVCVWCVTYAASVIATWVALAVSVRRPA